MSPPDALLTANAAATWLMCGVIWFVQLVHYPLFPAYDRAWFRAAMSAHQAATQRVVFPAMVLELGTALALLAWQPAGVPEWVPWLGAALVGVWGFTTALVMVPLHERLAREGFDGALHQRLVRWNWVRTAAWSARGLGCAAVLAARLTEPG
ncbi:DUF1772 domain-containing protein [Gemmata sp.]|uniref:DUF1772 domain-containing protein n=1 Tax=Gemmata sp. TaxID=1914242 RepID=UPI003F6EC433